LYQPLDLGIGKCAWWCRAGRHRFADVPRYPTSSTHFGSEHYARAACKPKSSTSGLGRARAIVGLSDAIVDW